MNHFDQFVYVCGIFVLGVFVGLTRAFGYFLGWLFLALVFSVGMVAILRQLQRAQRIREDEARVRAAAERQARLVSLSNARERRNASTKELLDQLQELRKIRELNHWPDDARGKSR